jgi:hypothetical protein
MNIEGVAQTLFDEFDDKEFLTRDIPSDAMDKLVQAMGISETDIHARNTKVGKRIGSMHNTELLLNSGRSVTMVVTRPENKRLPRRFKFETCS